MSNSSQAAEPQLNATPLIDVLLVLIVMLIFTMPVMTHSANVTLPQVGPRASARSDRPRHRLRRRPSTGTVIRSNPSPRSSADCAAEQVKVPRRRSSPCAPICASPLRVRRAGAGGDAARPRAAPHRSRSVARPLETRAPHTSWLRRSSRTGGRRSRTTARTSAPACRWWTRAAAYAHRQARLLVHESSGTRAHSGNQCVAGFAAMQVDEARARQPRREVVAVRADALEEAAPTFALAAANCVPHPEYVRLGIDHVDVLGAPGTGTFRPKRRAEAVMAW